MKLLFTAGLFAWLLISAITVAGGDPDLPAPPPVPAQATGRAETGRAKSDDEVIPASAIAPPGTIAEARARAMLLHETIAGALQVMHRDFFDEEDVRAIPSASLEDVFHELLKSHDVTVRWLIVDTDVVNVDHEAQDSFEENAAKSLAKGQPRFETIEEGRYRYAGPIRLASQCLKCHVKDRTSTDERTAGLLIAMPLQIPDQATNGAPQSEGRASD